MYDCIVNETYRKRSIMADKITLVTTKGNRADVPVDMYTDDSDLNLTTLASIIDSAAAYAVKDLGGVEPAGRSVWDGLTAAIQNPCGVEPADHVADKPTDHASDACHAADARHCGENQHVHMPKITMNEIPTVTMNEIAGEDDGDELKDISDQRDPGPLHAFWASLESATVNRRVAPGQLHAFVKEAVLAHRFEHHYKHHSCEDPILTFDYVDGYGVRSTKSVVLSLTETDPDNDWFTTCTDGEYRSFRYDRIKGDYVVVKYSHRV